MMDRTRVGRPLDRFVPHLRDPIRRHASTAVRYRTCTDGALYAQTQGHPDACAQSAHARSATRTTVVLVSLCQLGAGGGIGFFTGTW